MKPGCQAVHWIVSIAFVVLLTGYYCFAGFSCLHSALMFFLLADYAMGCTERELEAKNVGCENSYVVRSAPQHPVAYEQIEYNAERKLPNECYHSVLLVIIKDGFL